MRVGVRIRIRLRVRVVALAVDGGSLLPRRARAAAAVHLVGAAVVHDAEAEHLRDLERVVGVEGADGVEAGQQIVVEVELA